MNLNMYIIADELMSCSPQLFLHTSTKVRSIAYVALFEDKQSMNRNAVYVVEANTLPENIDTNKPLSLICIGDVSKNYKNSQFFDLICLPSNFRLSHIFNFVQQIFYLYGSWNQSLQQSVFDNEGINKLAELSLPIFKNDILIHDGGFKIVCFAAYGNKIYPPDLYNQLQNNKYFPKEFVESLVQQNQFEGTFDVVEPGTWYDEDYKSDSIFINIPITDDYLIRISIEANMTPIKTGYLALITVLADYVKVIFSRFSYQSNSSPFYLSRMLKDLIDSKFIQETVFEEQLIYNGWKYEDEYLCGRLEPETNRSMYALMSICERLEHLFIGCCAFTYEDCVVIVVNLKKQGVYRDDFLSHFELALIENSLFAGISCSFDSLNNLKSYYIQAEAALKFGHKLNSPLKYSCFEDHALQYILKNGTRDLSPELICPEGLLRVIRYDKQHSTRYYQTLRTYLENDCSVTISCKKLYIHRSTFLYRLNKLKQMIGLDLENTNSKLMLRISFCLIDNVGIFRSD